MNKKTAEQLGEWAQKCSADLCGNDIPADFTIEGAAWCNGADIGGTNLETQEFNRKNFLFKEFKNFGRLDPVSRSISGAVAVLLHDAGLYPSEDKFDIPVLFSSDGGSIRSDGAYYRDFIKYNETAGRANLFLYTLPTSPLGEVSVHFGLTGPLLFFTSANKGEVLFEIASMQMMTSRTGYLLMGVGEESAECAKSFFMLLKSTVSN